jgi:hypothetical protein
MVGGKQTLGPILWTGKAQAAGRGAMQIALVWFLLAVVVGVAANTRGRFGFGWFLLAVVLSPLIAGLLVLALPRTDTPALPRADAKAANTPFTMEGAVAGIPYRRLAGGVVEAMMSGGTVRFNNMEQFQAVAEGRDVSPGDTEQFDDEVSGVPYKIRPDGTILAKMSDGLRTFNSWAAFRKIVR